MAKSMAELPTVRFGDDDIMAGQLPAILARFAVENGPIFRRVVGSGEDAGQYVFMVGPEANRFVMHTGREHFSHDRGWTPLIGERFGRGLLTMDDPEHARHRRMWSPAFTATAMEAYVPVIQQVVAERTASWTARASIDVYGEAREITFDIAAAALAGIRRGPDVDRMREQFSTLLHFDGRAETWEQYLLRADSAQRELGLRLRELIAARRAAAPSERPADVVGAIVRARDEDGRELSDEQVLGHVNILLLAGHETTTTLASWVLYLLATMPEERRRLEAELAASAPPGSAPSVEVLRGLRRLDAFIREAGRLFPPVINVPRGVVSDFEFAGYRIPAGAQVRLGLAACHLLPSIFADPERFDPERFLPPREEDRRTPYALVTFGGGPRICIGVNFAQVEVKALAAHVLAHYELAPLAPPSAHAGYWSAVLEDGIRLQARAR